jgi:hypothetical protein
MAIALRAYLWIFYSSLGFKMNGQSRMLGMLRQEDHEFEAS